MVLTSHKYLNSNFEYVGSLREPLLRSASRLLRTGIFGNGLGAFRHSVLGQFTWQKQTDSRLNLTRGDGMTLVVVRQARRLGSYAFEDVIHERIHDRHGFR